MRSSRFLHFVTALLLIAGVASSLSAAASFSVVRSGPAVADRPALVFIPGLACNGSVWDEALARYQDRYDCHVLSLAGFAGSPPAEVGEAFLNTVRDELVAYLAEQKLVRPILIGHSLGGFVGLKVSLAAPEALGGLLIVDSLPFLPAAMNPAATAESMRAMAGQQRTMMAQGQFSADQARAMMATMVTDPANLERAVALSAASDPAAVAQAMYELNTTDLRDALSAARTPTVVLGAWIAYRAYGSTEESTRAIFTAQYAQHPHCRIEMSAIGRHFIQWDDPDFFHAQLQRLIAETR